MLSILRRGRQCFGIIIFSFSLICWLNCFLKSHNNDYSDPVGRRQRGFMAWLRFSGADNEGGQRREEDFLMRPRLSCQQRLCCCWLSLSPKATTACPIGLILPDRIKIHEDPSFRPPSPSPLIQFLLVILPQASNNNAILSHCWPSPLQQRMKDVPHSLTFRWTAI